MDRESRAITSNPQMKEALRRTGVERFGGMLVCGHERPNRELIGDAVHVLGLSADARYRGRDCDLYARGSVTPGS
jgi:hypothetical protein